MNQWYRKRSIACEWHVLDNLARVLGSFVFFFGQAMISRLAPRTCVLSAN